MRLAELRKLVAGYHRHTAIAQRRSLTIARLFAESHGSRLVGRTQKRHDQGQARAVILVGGFSVG
jgi:hypothetical protein